MAKNIKTIGQFKDLSHSKPIFRYEAPSKHLNTVWQRCGLLSNFFGKSISYLLKSKDSSINIDSLAEIYSYLINELLENIANFGLHENHGICSFSFWNNDNKNLISEFFNISNVKNATSFISTADKLINSKDINELYIKKIEENAMNNSSGSGLGFFSLINDYSVKFAFKFEKIADNYGITIQSLLNVKEI